MKKKRIVGLDGLRAFAILTITLFHFFPSIVKGGYLGVSLFFILSGFLITLSKPDSWLSYFKKRILRLHPALIVMIFGTLGIYYFFLPQGISAIRNEVLSILSGWNNWWQIGQNADYFTRIANASPFTPMWFLSIEMQFYVLWPLFFLLFYKSKEKKDYRFAQAIFLGLTLLSGLAMFIMACTGFEITRLYYGTDTRLFSLLMGVCLGFAYQQHPFRPLFPKQAGVPLCLILLMIACFICDGQSSIMYLGGLFGISLLQCLFLQETLCASKTWISYLEWKPLVWIGQHSYELFLWQYPVIYFFQAKEWDQGIGILFAFLAIAVLAWWTHALVTRNYGKTNKVLIYGLCAATTFFCVIGTEGLMESKAEKETASIEKQLAANAKALKKQKKKKVKPAKTISIDNVYCVGDSVMLGSAIALQEVLPNVQINAEVSRHIGAEFPSVQAALEAGQIGKVVVVSLGTNGPLYEDLVNQLLDALGSDREIFWVNVYGPNLSWQDENNQIIASLAKERKNVHEVDWYSVISPHPEWLAGDGIHPNTEGVKAYANVVKTTIEQTKERK